MKATNFFRGFFGRPGISSKANPGISFTAALLFCVALISVPIRGNAQAGKLDSTFGAAGIFSLSSGALGTTSRIQSDGKILIGGQINSEAAIVRLLSNGTLDSTFGNNGIVSITFPGDLFDGAQVVGMAIQSDGKIVAGVSNLQQGFGPLFILARLNSNGSSDGTFGVDGIAETQVGGSGGSFGAAATALAVQPDGRILLAGQNSEPSGASGAIARYETNGLLDETFGSGGIAPTSIPNPSAIALQPDGRILLAAGGNPAVFGAPSVNLAGLAGVISRFNPNGTPDTTFGIAGKAATLVVAGALAVQTNGICTSTCQILVGGTIITNSDINSGSSFGFGITRLNGNGATDETFGQGGIAETAFLPSQPDVTAFALALQTNGDILSGGSAGRPGNGEFLTPAVFALARYTSAGASDGTFGASGKVTTAFGNNQAAIYSLALQSDGKIVAVGTSSGSGGGIVAARYLAQ